MRRIGAAFVLLVMVTACSTPGPGPTTAPGATYPGQPTDAGQATGAGGGTGQGVIAAAQAANAHPCALLPTDIVATLIPNAPVPQEELFPPQCSVFGEAAALAFRVDISPFTVPAGSQEVPGFPLTAYLEKLTTGNWTLWVPLTADTGYLFVEVNNQDGKDHTDDVVNLAKAILAKLGG